MPSTFGPYSPIRQAGELYFVSGQIGVDPAIKSAAANAGLGLGDVVKTTVFLTDMGDFAAMNEVYLKHFTSTPRPARSCVAVAELPRVADVPLKIEIEAIADQNLAEARALSDLP
jgi:2-iminobutanoate/2-iminopropanoate deaminase